MHIHSTSVRPVQISRQRLSAEAEPARAPDDYSVEIEAIYGENRDKARSAFWKTAVPITLGVTALGAAYGGSFGGDLLRNISNGAALGAVLGVPTGLLGGVLAQANAECS